MRHEASDAALGPVVMTGIGLAVVVVLMAFVAGGVYSYLTANPPVRVERDPFQAQKPQPPRPRVEEKPWLELPALRSEEDRILNHYGWADKGTGAVRIPVSRAMELQLERGFPVRKGGVQK